MYYFTFADTDDINGLLKTYRMLNVGLMLRSYMHFPCLQITTCCSIAVLKRICFLIETITKKTYSEISSVFE